MTQDRSASARAFRAARRHGYQAQLAARRRAGRNDGIVSTAGLVVGVTGRRPDTELARAWAELAQGWASLSHAEAARSIAAAAFAVDQSGVTTPPGACLCVTRSQQGLEDRPVPSGAPAGSRVNLGFLVVLKDVRVAEDPAGHFARLRRGGHGRRGRAEFPERLHVVADGAAAAAVAAVAELGVQLPDVGAVPVPPLL